MAVTKSHAEGLASREGLRRELLRIAELLDSVMRVHGPVHLALRDLPPVFRGLRAELESQLEIEERTLLSACRALDGAGRVPVASIHQAMLAHEAHRRRVGGALAALRRLTDDYDVAGALCRTHRRLLEGLRELERDVDRHLDEEIDVRLSRMRAEPASSAGGRAG
jgi:regulator of cell morphogenesis and NO signaling